MEEFLCFPSGTVLHIGNETAYIIEEKQRYFLSIVGATENMDGFFAFHLRQYSVLLRLSSLR